MIACLLTLASLLHLKRLGLYLGFWIFSPFFLCILGVMWISKLFFFMMYLSIHMRNLKNVELGESTVSFSFFCALNLNLVLKISRPMKNDDVDCECS